MGDIKYFKHKQCLISYSEHYKTKELFFLLGVNKKVTSPMIYIDLIEVKKNFRHEGMGSESLKFFLEKMKSKGFKDFVLIASYNPTYYNSEISDINWLINFYKKFGFQVVEDLSSEEKLMVLTN